jgi:hypothetical protein
MSNGEGVSVEDSSSPCIYVGVAAAQIEPIPPRF